MLVVLSFSVSVTSATTVGDDIVDTAVGSGSFPTLVAALTAAGWVEPLKGQGPFTVFAPNEAAFAALPPGTIEMLLMPENKEKLADILTYHVVPGKIMAADVMAMAGPGDPKTVQGSTVHVTNMAPVMVNDANVVQTDIEASNGVIHVVDRVPLPK